MYEAKTWFASTRPIGTMLLPHQRSARITRHPITPIVSHPYHQFLCTSRTRYFNLHRPKMALALAWANDKKSKRVGLQTNSFHHTWLSSTTGFPTHQLT
ncbi:unnamed protein product [Colias eurytheme]|nr:unnamed protein product [Colias eurytheme]